MNSLVGPARAAGGGEERKRFLWTQDAWQRDKEEGKRTPKARREKKVGSVWEGRGVERLQIRICMEMGHIC